jgi:microcystin-dependent protein
MDCADGILEDLGFELTTCEGMDADPPNDPCERAMKQLTALILNVCSDRLGGELCDGVEVSCASTTVEELLGEIAELIDSEDCKQAARCAVMVNAGFGLVDDENDCNNCVADGTADGDILTWDNAGNNWVARPGDKMQPYLGINFIIALQGIFPSRSSAEPFIGEISMFAGNFAPRGWAFCDGQLLPISQYSALFSLLGITYGGDGRTTFGLPDLRGRVPLHPGTGPGLTPRTLGKKGGSETH